MPTPFLLLVGALQGGALWWLLDARTRHLWPATDPVAATALLYATLALPCAIYLTHGIAGLGARRRGAIVAAVAAAFAALGAYAGWAEGASAAGAPASMFAAAVLGFVLLPLLAHAQPGLPPRWPYQRLFETAWRNGVLAAVAAAFAGVFWLALFACAMLMSSIGVRFFRELIVQPLFAFPVTGIVVAAAVAFGVARGETIVGLRRFWLSITRWLLPLMMAFAVLWVAALPFTGVESLFKTRNAGLALLWFVALAVSFANSAYQDGGVASPYGRWLDRAVAWAWAAMPVVAFVAGWALWLRVRQHGWSEERVWGAFVLLLAGGYALGYAWAGLRPRGARPWMHPIGAVNTWVALALCAGLLLLLSPAADPRRLAVDDQLARLARQAVDADKFDYAYLRWRAGRYGQQALERLAAGADAEVAARAGKALAQTNRYARVADDMPAAQMQARMNVLPAGRALDERLAAHLGSSDRFEVRRCREPKRTCTVWYVDLDADGADEAVLLPSDMGMPRPVYRIDARDVRRIGTLAGTGRADDLLAAIGAGQYALAAPRWLDVEVAGTRLRLLLDASAGARD